jgi:hypothetical protein
MPKRTSPGVSAARGELAVRHLEGTLPAAEQASRRKDEDKAIRGAGFLKVNNPRVMRFLLPLALLEAVAVLLSACSHRAATVCGRPGVHRQPGGHRRGHRSGGAGRTGTVTLPVARPGDTGDGCPGGMGAFYCGKLYNAR